MLNVAAGASDPRQYCKNLGPASARQRPVRRHRGLPKAILPELRAPRRAAWPDPTPNPVPAMPRASARRFAHLQPVTCNGSVCYAACTDSTQCVTGNVCPPRPAVSKPLGERAGLGKECGSSFCAQGVCCENACTGACMPATSRHRGLCVSVPDNSSDRRARHLNNPDHTCGSPASALAGLCLRSQGPKLQSL